jgi:NAD(P)-dependent dehydrogenase (short-subunit alcohol dehydrogenase family)
MRGTALVTGGGSGIGRAIALALVGAGMRVAVASRAPEQVAGALALTCDVTRRGEVERTVGSVERELGPVDLLVNSAGVARWEERAWEDDPDAWWRVFEVNVLGTYLCCRAVMTGMVERRSGRIVNLGSAAGYLPTAPAAYGASKAALHRLTESLALQAAENGVFVFTISPGLVNTAMNADAFPASAPWTSPDHAAKLVCTLASGRLDRLSGRFLHAVDDDVEDLVARADEIVADDLNAVRLRR